MQIRVYYEDTDCGNVVYYANYLGYMERSRTELLRSRGIPLSALHATGTLFIVAHADISYKSSARYDDLLDVESTVTSVSGASMIIATDICREGSLLVRGVITLACVNAAGKPKRIPAELREALAGGI